MKLMHKDLKETNVKWVSGNIKNSCAQNIVRSIDKGILMPPNTMLPPWDKSKYMVPGATSLDPMIEDPDLKEDYKMQRSVELRISLQVERLEWRP